MTARQKLQTLSNSWYGYALFCALVSLFQIRATGILSMAIGLTLSLVLNAVMLVISLALVTFFARKLLARSSATRAFLVFVSGLCTVLGVLGTAGAAWAFLGHWSFAGIVSIALGAISVWMNARSFGVLTTRDVKAYFI
jgi:hypothetical protein